ncbi:hypothetical protein ACVIHC_008975 [Bradyrhizobium diazoefficiens]
MDDPTKPIQDHHAVGTAHPWHSTNACLEQAYSFEPNLLRERKLNMIGRDHRQRDIVTMKDRLGAGKIDDAYDAAVDRATNGATDAGPGLDALGKMLRGVDMNRLSCDERRANAVGAGHRLSPGGADFEANIVPGIDRPLIAPDIKHDTIPVGDDQHCGRIAKYFRNAAESLGAGA